MVYLFCMGLLQTQDISLSSVDYCKRTMLSKSNKTMFKSVIDLHKKLQSEHSEILGPEMLKLIRKNFAEVSARLY